MRTKSLKCISVLLTVMLLLSCTFALQGVNVFAAESGTCGDNLTWTLDDEGTLTISGTGDMWWGNPEYNDAPWKKNSQSVKKVIINEGVTSVSGYAFYFVYGKIKSVSLPSTLKTIGERAFAFCVGIEEINIPSGVTSIGLQAFETCQGLTGSIVIPDSVTELGYGAFEMCNGIESITVGSGIRRIEEYTFYGCSSLTDMTIGENVEYIGQNVFMDCSSLESIVIPDSIEYVESGSFDDTPWYAAQPDGVVYISRIAYAYKGEMPANTEIVIPDGVVTIGDSAFEGCVNLTDVTMPSSLRTIGVSAFQNCTGLTEIVIPDGVVTIDRNAFSGCVKLIDVTVPTSVKKINIGAFNLCGTEAGETAILIIYYPGVKAKWDEISKDAHINDYALSTIDTRIYGSNRFETAAYISAHGWAFDVETVVLANGMNYADALAGVPLAYELDAPILLTAGKAELEYTVYSMLNYHQPKNIVILGGAGAVSEAIETSLIADGYNVERIYGLSRYETALETSKALVESPETAVIVTGNGYADALSVGPCAAMRGYPIVYSHPNTGLDAETLAYLENTENIIIIGGTGAVGEIVEQQLEGKNINRIFGLNRFATSCEIANYFSDDFDNIITIATGTNFPDALAGGVLAAKLGSPVLLIHPNGASDELKQYVAGKELELVVVLGGTGVVPDKAVGSIFE